MSCFQAFDIMCKKIICPTRHSNINQRDLIQRKFKRNHVPYQQFTVTNTRLEKLSVICFPRDFQNYPTVLYLHGNGGHKMECLQITNPNINLFAFDFSGCGKSEGNYVTYGDREVEDIHCVVKEIKKKYGVRRLALWGRSMGSSLALMYASLNPREVLCMVLDTPFRSLKETVRNVAEYNNKSVPSFIINFIIYLIESKLEEMISVNVFRHDFLMHLNLLNDMPILFVYSSEDVVVTGQNVKQLYGAYKGRKQLCKIEALHHQDRPKFMVEEGIRFIIDEEGNRSTRSSMTNFSRRGIALSTRRNTYF